MLLDKKITRKVLQQDKGLLAFDVFKSEAAANIRKSASKQTLSHAQIRRLPVHSYERIEALAAILKGPARQQMLRAARSKHYLTRYQFKLLVDGVPPIATSERRRRNKLLGRTKSNRKRKPTQYKTYIISEHWERRKNVYWQSHSKLCAICLSPDYVQLHHMYYDRKLFGSEPDDHLMPLCQDHHHQYHQRYGTQKDMVAKTHLFIIETRRALINAA